MGMGFSWFFPVLFGIWQACRDHPLDLASQEHPRRWVGGHRGIVAGQVEAPPKTKRRANRRAKGKLKIDLDIIIIIHANFTVGREIPSLDESFSLRQNIIVARRSSSHEMMMWPDDKLLHKVVCSVNRMVISSLYSCINRSMNEHTHTDLHVMYTYT